MTYEMLRPRKSHYLGQPGFSFSVPITIFMPTVALLDLDRLISAVGGAHAKHHSSRKRHSRRYLYLITLYLVRSRIEARGRSIGNIKASRSVVDH